MPKKTPEEAAVRDKAMQEGLKKAVEVPFNLAKEVNRLWPTLVRLAALGNQATISDLKVSEICLRLSYTPFLKSNVVVGNFVLWSFGAVTWRCCQVGARCLETSVWGAYHNVATNLKELREDETKSELQAEIDEAVRVAQDGLQMVLSALAEREGN